METTVRQESVVTLTLRMPASVAEQVKRLAKRERRTQNGQIVLLLEEALRRAEKEENV